MKFTRGRHRCSSSFPLSKSSFRLTGSNSSFIFGKVCECLVSSCSLDTDAAKEIYELKCCQILPQPQETTSQQQPDVWRQVELGGRSLTELLKRCFVISLKKNLCQGQSVTGTLAVCKHINQLCVCVHILFQCADYLFSFRPFNQQLEKICRMMNSKKTYLRCVHSALTCSSVQWGCYLTVSSQSTAQSPRNTINPCEKMSCACE